MAVARCDVAFKQQTISRFARCVRDQMLIDGEHRAGERENVETTLLLLHSYNSNAVR